jgi:hypothetical protein
MTLEAMNLDRREEFKGDAFDPFKMGGNGFRSDLALKEGNKYMGVSNTIG